MCILPRSQRADPEVMADREEGEGRGVTRRGQGPTIAVDGAVSAGLLAVALDLLAPALVARACDPAALLDGEAAGALLGLDLGLVVRGRMAAAVERALLVRVPGQGVQIFVV